MTPERLEEIRAYLDTPAAFTGPYSTVVACDLLDHIDRLTAERDELRRRLAAFEDGQPRLDPQFIRRDGPTP